MTNKDLCVIDVLFGCLQSIKLLHTFTDELKNIDPTKIINEKQLQDVKKACEYIITQLTVPKTTAEIHKIMEEMLMDINKK